MYNKMLYALDLTSKPHLLKAIAIAQQLNADLFVGFVTQLGETYLDDDIYYGKTLGDNIAEKDKSKLEEKITTMIAGTSITNDHIYIVDGPVGKALERLSEDLHIDLVVMAKSHHHFNLFMKHDKQIIQNSRYDTLTLS